MSRTNPKTIELDARGRHEELVLDGAYVPGMLLEMSSATNAQVHGTAAGVAERMFLKEDALQGKTVDDAYAAGDIGMLTLVAPGDRVYAVVASGVTVTPGTKLESAGNGKLRAFTTGAVIGVSLEDSGGALAADTKLIVRCI